MSMSVSLSANKAVGALLAPGCEEVGAFVVVGTLSRAGVRAGLIAASEDLKVVPSRGISVTCNLLLAQADLTSYELLLLPGGIPGTMNLTANEQVYRKVGWRTKAELDFATICTTSSILASRGHLKGRRATANLGFVETIAEGGACALEERVVINGPPLTNRSAGIAFESDFAIAGQFLGKRVVGAVREALVY